LHNPLDRDEHLKRLSILDFMILDLGLYLNNNPDDAQALSIFATVSQDANDLRSSYEKTYGPLTKRSQASAGDCWKWISNPWPWEVEANYEL